MPPKGEKKTFSQWQQTLETGNSRYLKVVDRIDKANLPSDPQDHIHFRDGHALQRDGTWKHGKGRPLSVLEKEFCELLEFRLPAQ